MHSTSKLSVESPNKKFSVDLEDWNKTGAENDNARD